MYFIIERHVVLRIDMAKRLNEKKSDIEIEIERERRRI